MRTKNGNSMVKVIYASCFVLLLAACTSNGSDYAETLGVESTNVSSDFKAIDSEVNNDYVLNEEQVAKPVEDLKIIKSAQARYKVIDVKLATSEIKAIATQFNAYISDQRFENNRFQKENRFTVKVPQAHFDAMMDSIAGVAEYIEYENITTKDVTEEYVDINSRLKTKLEVKQRYEEVLRNSAKTVKDILATEEKLQRIQEEIESAQGRLAYLTSKVSYSTIQIDLYETVEYTEEPTTYTKTFGDKSKNGLSFGWTMIETIIIALIHVWPLLLFGTLLFFFVRRKLK